MAMSNSPTLNNSKNTASKELIRRNIRHALASKNLQPLKNPDTNMPLYPQMEQLLKQFVDNFRSQGGKCRLCHKSSFFEDLSKFIHIQKYDTILNTCDFLSSMLTEYKINFQTCINPNESADLAIVYADFFIARSGNLLFSQEFTLYPSVKNLAKDILIVGFATNVVPDVKIALDFRRKNEHLNQSNFREILAPVPPYFVDGEEVFTPSNPRLILLLINE